MHDSPLPSVPVSITGPLSAIERLLEQEVIPDAHRYELHGIVWIEVPEISADQAKWVARHNCKVHYSRFTPIPR
jgi:hypothetical protein